MTFVTDYLQGIDIIALVAVAALAIAAFYRSEGFWVGLLGVVVILWVASRFFNMF